MKVHLAHGPNHKQSVAKSFPDGIVPPQLLGIRGRNALCLKTGKKFKVENDEQFLLVPSVSLRAADWQRGCGCCVESPAQARSLIKPVTDAAISRGRSSI